MLQQCHKKLVGTHAIDRPEQARACTQASRRAGRPAADKQVATLTAASLAAKSGGKFYMLSSLRKNTNFDGFRDPRFAACSGSTFCAATAAGRLIQPGSHCCCCSCNCYRHSACWPETSRRICVRPGAGAATRQLFTRKSNFLPKLEWLLMGLAFGCQAGTYPWWSPINSLTLLPCPLDL